MSVHYQGFFQGGRDIHRHCRFGSDLLRATAINTFSLKKLANLPDFLIPLKN
jgi:hypothetical protein